MTSDRRRRQPRGRGMPLGLRSGAKLAAVAFSTFSRAPAWSLEVHPPASTSIITRRQVLLTTTSVTASSILALSTQPSNAVQGAAEYDLEYYFRDLFGGNAKEGTVRPSAAPPVPPPRTLQGPLLPLLLNDSASVSCVPTQTLLQLNPKLSEADIIKSVQEYRDKVSRSFAARAAWKEPHVHDQYYFDITSYALWRTAADLIPDYRQRDIFARNVGRGIFNQLIQQNLVKVKDNDSANSSSSSRRLTSTVPAMMQILKLFEESNYCKGFRVGDRDSSTSSNNPIFDALDDEDIESGVSVNCLVSVYEPATLGASLQIVGEQSRFIPEYVGATLAALWEQAGIQTSYETYFVDPEYRPNPKDYFPNEQLLQFTLSKK